MVRNFKAVITYDGTPYSGWQIQPQLTTVQGKLAGVLHNITGENVLPQGSGRTDSGVHALGQVASFSLESPIPLANLYRAMNDKLPNSIRVLTLEEAAVDFHARHAAKAKTYEYRIFRGEICSPFRANHVLHIPWPLDLENMQLAAEVIIGEHDFTSFAARDPDKTQRETEIGSDDDREGNVRTLFSSGFTQQFAQQSDDLVYTVRGNGFLHHMVRNLMGTFLLVGKGTLSPNDFVNILAAKDRTKAGPTEAPQGLYLVNVEY